jgi:hypothetical protein
MPENNNWCQFVTSWQNGKRIVENERSDVNRAHFYLMSSFRMCATLLQNGRTHLPEGGLPILGVLAG